MANIVIEQDAFLRMLAPMIDLSCTPENRLAVYDFFAHDEPDIAAWCERLRARLPGLAPAHVTFAEDQASLARLLRDADGVIVESLEIGAEELAGARRLRVVQKYGFTTRNIDHAACAAHGASVETQRRRVNAAVAEQAFALLIALAKRIHGLAGIVTAKHLERAGYPIKPYDRRYTGSSNFARIGGLRTLSGATLGLIGMGEIGRGLAERCAAFGMNVVYTQRNRLAPADELPSRAAYLPMGALLAQSDYVSVNLPMTDSTRGIVGAREFAAMKDGCMLINVARAELVDRNALLGALTGGRLGGIGFDVWYEEPVAPDDPVLKFENALLMPHTAVGARAVALQDIEEMLTKMWKAITAPPVRAPA